MSSKAANENRKTSPSASNQSVPAWIWGLGAIMLSAVIFASFQTVQANQQLEQSKDKLATMSQSASQAQKVHEELVKETTTLREDLTAAKSQLSLLKKELQNANASLEQARTESKKHEMAANANEALLQKQQEEAERNATQPTQSQ